MSLLREIQSFAIDSRDIELANLLRKCTLLASRLGNSDFSDWVGYELNGYPDDDKCPSYRILSLNSKGNFYGTSGSQMLGASIPTANFLQEDFSYVEKCFIRQGVSALENLWKKADGQILQAPWPSNLVAKLSRSIYENMTCESAWFAVPASSIAGILDTVRNKILNFSIEIEKNNPDAGESPTNSEPVKQETIIQIFNTEISGTGHNIATGSTNVNQNNKNNEMALFDDLLKSLSKLDSEAAKVNELIKIVEEMKRTQGTRGFKEHYFAFISSLSDHISVFGNAVAPHLPALTKFL